MRTTFGILLALSILVSSHTGLARAEISLHQPLLPPVELDRIGMRVGLPLRLHLSSYQLPGGERVEDYQFGGWVRLGQRSVVGGGLRYVGLEDESFTRYGGGPPWLQLSTHAGDPVHRSVAFDIAFGIPLGDKTLYPISSKATSLTIRTRWSALRTERHRLWVGWWARRVSPPNEDDPDLKRPGSDYPSGSGLMLAAQGVAERWAWELSVRQDLNGLPESTWIAFQSEWIGRSGVGVLLGASTTAGPRAQRPLDFGWSLGLVLRGAAPSPDSESP